MINYGNDCDQSYLFNFFFCPVDTSDARSGVTVLSLSNLVSDIRGHLGLEGHSTLSLLWDSITSNVLGGQVLSSLGRFRDSLISKDSDVDSVDINMFGKIITCERWLISFTIRLASALSKYLSRDVVITTFSEAMSFIDSLKSEIKLHLRTISGTAVIFVEYNSKLYRLNGSVIDSSFSYNSDSIIYGDRVRVRSHYSSGRSRNFMTLSFVYNSLFNESIQGKMLSSKDTDFIVLESRTVGSRSTNTRGSVKGVVVDAEAKASTDTATTDKN